MEPINLDALTPEELADTERALLFYWQYAELKLLAMQRRLAGKIKDALEIESRCELIYKAMPSEIKW